MIRHAIGLALLGVAAWIGNVATATARDTPADFPYPGAYVANMCSLDIAADGAFVMSGYHCDFPEDPDTITVRAGGHARMHGDVLQLYFGDTGPDAGAPQRELLVTRCDGGVRILDEDDQHTVALAMHSADPSDMWFGAGFVSSVTPTGGNCDTQPLPGELRRIAQAAPVRASVVEVGESRCEKLETFFSCQARIRLDRGADAGLADGMSLFFPDCPAAESGEARLDGVAADSASGDIHWTADAEEPATRFIGHDLVSRMPACLVPVRERMQTQD